MAIKIESVDLKDVKLNLRIENSYAWFADLQERLEDTYDGKLKEFGRTIRTMLDKVDAAQSYIDKPK